MLKLKNKFLRLPDYHNVNNLKQVQLSLQHLVVPVLCMHFPYVASLQSISNKKPSAIIHGTLSSMDASPATGQVAITSTNQGEDQYENKGSPCIPTYLSPSQIVATIHGKSYCNHRHSSLIIKETFCCVPVKSEQQPISLKILLVQGRKKKEK